MITLEEAQKIMLKSAEPLPTERIHFQNVINRVLAEDVISDLNMPPFDKSAMDGYACRAEDLANTLEVVEIIPAGTAPKKKIGKNQCAKIMTGAMLPQGANTVIIVEDTEKIDQNHIRYLKEKSKPNICYLAEDVKKGDIVLKKGTLIASRHIPVLASVGAVNPMVYKQPKVAVITTGSELVEPDQKPSVSQIRNSNAYSIQALLKEKGFNSQYFGISLDTKEETRQLLTKATEFADVVIFSGAVSMGDFDYVPDVLKEFGVKILFHGVAVKPGKKTIFGKNKNKYFIGVPGNPVSAFMQTQQLIVPFLFKLTGTDYIDFAVKLPLKDGFKRKRGHRKEFIPVKITNNQVELLEYHGSAHINGLSYADAIMEIDLGVTEIKKGELVNVRPF